MRDAEDEDRRYKNYELRITNDENRTVKNENTN